MIIIFTLIVFLIDIGSKLIVGHLMYTNESISVINNFLNITYVKNMGAAWSILADKSFIVLILSAMIIFAIILYVYKNKPNLLGEKIAYSFILGGALGNFFNRIIDGYVTDFIDVKIFGYDYPIFNFADCFIVVGVITLIIFAWRGNNGNKSCR